MKQISFILLTILFLNACKQESIDSTLPTRDAHLAMGNPSAATTDVNQPNNYLMEKSTYALSYNNSKGSANWVAWHLSDAWKGDAPRSTSFVSDSELPSTFYKAVTSNYTNSGFDRGHQCPSEDRDSTADENKSTFLMTNILPQSPKLNQGPWKDFETYCRTLMSRGNELYIYSGGYGKGGEGDMGTANTLANGKIQVPSHCWKVALILPIGSEDVDRVSADTRIIAVDMPNVQSVTDLAWYDYRVSVDAIEAATQYDFFSKVPIGIQQALEANPDTKPVN